MPARKRETILSKSAPHCRTTRSKAPQVNAQNAAEVQEKAQQIEAEIRRLEELSPDGRGSANETDDYFERPPATPQAVGARGFAEVFDESFADLDGADRQDDRKGLDDRQRGTEPQRDRLREQAAEQLDRLQTRRAEPQVRRTEVRGEQSSDLATADHGAAAADITLEPAKEDSAQEGGPARTAAPSEKAGYLSLDLDLALVGTAYHFRKLQGDPQLLLHARHERLGRYLAAALWAIFCLALAAVTIYVVRQRDADKMAGRIWPWLVAIAGAAWWFLLPAAPIGLFLLVVALCGLIARWRKRLPTDLKSAS